MKLVMLSSQSDLDDEYVIVWAFDIETKLIIKIHTHEKLILSISVGDIVEIQYYLKWRRQEIWAKAITKIDNESVPLKICLENKSATPYSVRNQRFVGNIVKIENFISVEGLDVRAELYGFPKEIFYLRINDLKWKYFFSNSHLENDDWKQVKDSLNSFESVFGIVDFQDENNHGKIQIAALVVF